jgi:imidazolonepropionase-like amidohydrolase
VADYIVNGTLIDGTGRKPAPLHFLKLAAGRIEEVCTDPGKPLPPDANVVLNAKDMTVMPGMVDAHCHLSYGDARSIEEQDLYGSPEYRAIRGVWHAGKVLRAGVTSVSDPGGSWQVAVAVRDAIKAGMFPGPRITAAGRYLTSHTGLADYFPAWVGNVPSGVGALATNHAEMLDEIRR